ncbi:hypothetical protein RJ639_016054 [Escallonia herrerae]|uniref:Multidrug and toxin extrusion protein n=1 Tax=Escallonia herrerae TaxID=1293975 RepID=A0AA88VFQ7_9ASTE|nr:hypothetical protein RJ639_016054 [Escallonia herrerae]
MWTPLVTENPTLNQKEVSQSKSRNQISLAIAEAKCIANISLPMVLTGLILYSRSMISMLFLGRLGELSLAGGALAIVFANITGYSILSGLAMGMEPICGQAFGARRFKLLGLTLQKAVLLLLLTSIPISFLWCNVKKILLFCGQEDDIASVALSGVWTNFNLVGSLIAYILVSGAFKKTWSGISLECLKGWKSLLDLAVPSCISVCLEWWCYEIMILSCGLLLKPQATVASMGILIQTTSLVYIFPSSLSFGVSTRIGNELGANSPKKAKAAAIVGISSSFNLGFSALCFTVMRLWLGLLAAQGSCVVTMMAALAWTDWDHEAERAKELTGTIAVDGDRSIEDEEKLVDEKRCDPSNL